MAALISAAVLLLLPSLVCAQAKVEGRVVNGTTNRPVPGQEIRLLIPRGGMQQVGTTKTGADGHFVFDAAGIDSKSFYLVSTDFQGVPYNTPATFNSNGAASVDLTVYDSTRSPNGLRIPAMRVLAGAEKDELRVQEEYAVQNSTNPPRAYAVPGATFSFRIPADAGTPTVSVAGLMNMPLPQTPAPGKPPGTFSIHYPMKPGVTTVTVQYVKPYEASGVELKDGASFLLDQAELYIYPSSLVVDAPGFQPAGIDNPHLIAKYQAAQLPAGASALDIRLSGESAAGPPPGSGQPAQGGQQEESQGGNPNGNQGAQEEVKVVPNSVSNLTAPVLAGLLLLLLWALAVRMMKEWPHIKAEATGEPAGRTLDPQAEKLLNSIADLDELFATGKIAEPKYWKERLELKARLVAFLKKSPPATLESYAARQNPH